MKRLVKVLRYAIGTVFIGTIVLYAVLLGMEAYSKREASQILDRIEGLRVGDSEAQFEAAVQRCPIEKDGSGIHCVVVSGAYRFAALWNAVWKLPDSWAESIWQFSNRMGLRYWRLSIFASAQDGRIKDVSTNLYIVGRYEALGTEWTVASALPSRYVRYTRSPEDERTYITWYHITSRPSGEGFGIYTTPESTNKELIARRINRTCFLSFRGCDGLCELLPNAIPLLVDRHRDWGGTTCVPKSHCDFKGDKWNPCNQIYSPVVPPPQAYQR